MTDYDATHVAEGLRWTRRGQRSRTTMTFTSVYATDANPPQIVDLDPAPGTPVSAGGAISFTLVDETLVAVFLSDGLHRVIYDSVAFAPAYTQSSVQAVTYDGRPGLRFTLRRAGGWLGTRIIRVRAVDSAGNHEVLV